MCYSHGYYTQSWKMLKVIPCYPPMVFQFWHNLFPNYSKCSVGTAGPLRGPSFGASLSDKFFERRGRCYLGSWPGGLSPVGKWCQEPWFWPSCKSDTPWELGTLLARVTEQFLTRMHIQMVFNSSKWWCKYGSVCTVYAVDQTYANPF